MSMKFIAKLSQSRSGHDELTVEANVTVTKWHKCEGNVSLK